MIGLPIPRLRHVRPRTVSSAIAAATLVAAQLGLGALPVAAAAPSLVITADQPPAVPAGHYWGFDDFFPRSLTVAQGTTIGFLIEGFHTATLLPAGVTVAQDLATAGIGQSDADDTSPNPNGTTHANENFAGLAPIPASGCGTDATPCTFDGTSVVSSGAPLAGPPTAPFDMTITAAPGTYSFHCRIHPLMTGQLTVVTAGSTGTTPAQLASDVITQVAADVAAGTAAEAAANVAGKQANADGTTTWMLTAGTESADGHTVVLEMLPQNVTIKSGDTVTWSSQGVQEPHTVTFPTELHTDSVPLCESGGVDTPAVPAVNPPQSPFDFKCGTGPADEFEAAPGNGVSTITAPSTVSDSGLLAGAGAAEANGLPASAALTSWTVHFTGAVAGKYTYICQIHGPPMFGTITIAAAAPPPPPTLPPTSTDSGASNGTPSGPLGWMVLVMIGALAFCIALAGRRPLRPTR